MEPMLAPEKVAENNLTPAQWLWCRLQEVPMYVVFHYNLLKDPRLPFSLKVYPFAGLRYLFSGRTVIPNQAPVFGYLDDLAVLMACNREMVNRLPVGTLCLYQQILHAEGIRLRKVTGEAPEKLGLFYFHMATVYRKLIESERDHLGNALVTTDLVRSINRFLTDYDAPSWDPEMAGRVDKFLQVYE